MKKVVFLTMDSLDGFECYDDLLIEPLSKYGWSVEKISWKKTGVNWNNYNVVIVRSAWDYQSDPDKFINVLTVIDNSSAKLENSLSILKWNMNKSYLKDLDSKGIKIVDTLWGKNFNKDNLPGYFDELNTGKIIIKPNISASAFNTFLVYEHNAEKFIPELLSVFDNKEFMVQPFLENIISEGEYSLFYFDGKFSHAIVKKPKQNDFRVQEEYGGILTSIIPDEQQLSISENILNQIYPLPLYARIDLVRIDKNNFALMELELIEPSLYFNMDSHSAKRFAEIFNNRMNTL